MAWFVLMPSIHKALVKSRSCEMVTSQFPTCYLPPCASPMLMDNDVDMEIYNIYIYIYKIEVHSIYIYIYIYILNMNMKRREKLVKLLF